MNLAQKRQVRRLFSFIPIKSALLVRRSVGWLNDLRNVCSGSWNVVFNNNICYLFYATCRIIRNLLISKYFDEARFCNQLNNFTFLEDGHHKSMHIYHHEGFVYLLIYYKH